MLSARRAMSEGSPFKDTETIADERKTHKKDRVSARSFSLCKKGIMKLTKERTGKRSEGADE